VATAPTPESQEPRGDAAQLPKPAGKNREWSRHPITLLLAGSALSAIVLPWIGARMNDRQLIDSARLRQCQTILENSAQVNRRLNGLLTTMEMFIKDTAFEVVLAQSERDRMRIELARQYREFDAHAWWWISGLPTEVKLLRIDVDSKNLGDILGRYQANLVESTAVLDGLWEACVRKEMKPGDPHTTGLASKTRAQFSALQSERQDLVGKLVYLLAPPEPTIQDLLRL
jgi:hypothetical protein